jgi:hypothetical protein
MADNDPLIIGRANTASPGAETILSRDNPNPDIVFSARNLNEGSGLGGASTNSFGVGGTSTNGIGVGGASTNGIGVTGFSSGFFGVRGSSDSVSGIGVRGQGLGANGTGVWGETNGVGFGVFGRSTGPTKFAGVFDGHMVVFNGNKYFKIDHPLDPENRYLLHTCVESSEMKNVYDGVARLDEDGAAWVDLPEWFEALNGDFRYQLTAVGGASPDLHVAEEISENRFKIAGGPEGMKVCWQVTGSRKDRWAAANPFEVEQEKSEEERGRYLQPDLYDAPEEQRVMIGPIAATLGAASISPTGEETMEELRRMMEEEAPPETT